jgi:co-chaperonin GroES (HSP10)
MFKPVNRYIQIELPKPKPQTTSSLVLPDDYKPTEERHITAEVVAYAPDVRFKDQLVMCGGPGTSVIIDKSMIEEISTNNGKINVILDNYVVGIIN